PQFLSSNSNPSAEWCGDPIESQRGQRSLPFLLMAPPAVFRLALMWTCIHSASTPHLFKLLWVENRNCNCGLCSSRVARFRGRRSINCASFFLEAQRTLSIFTFVAIWRESGSRPFPAND